VEIIAGLEAFLCEQPELRLQPVSDATVVIEGMYLLDATHPSAGRVTRSFKLQIKIPLDFPEELPIVFEVGGVIPQQGDFHVNQTDYSLCLGSHISLKRVLRDSGDISRYFAEALRPYLYAVSVKLERGGKFVFGELRHGSPGIVQDLADDLQIPESRVVDALALLTLPEEAALGQVCPCGCEQTLRNCETHARLCEVRTLASPEWFKSTRQRLLLELTVERREARTTSMESRQERLHSSDLPKAVHDGGADALKHFAWFPMHPPLSMTCMFLLAKGNIAYFAPMGAG
jgi:hypothetical protein